MPWTEQLIHFIDFEGALACGVLEYGIVSVRRGRIEEVRTRQCAPLGPISPEDIPVHGLTPAALAGFRPFAEDWELFAGLRAEAPFAAHFAGVENSLIKAAWPRTRASVDFVAPGSRTVEWGPWIDTARIYGGLRPAPPSLGLSALIAATGRQAELDQLAERHCPPARRRYHAALYDALAGAILLAQLGSDPRICTREVGHLLLVSTSDPDKRRAIVQPELW